MSAHLIPELNGMTAAFADKLRGKSICQSGAVLRCDSDLVVCLLEE